MQPAEARIPYRLNRWLHAGHPTGQTPDVPFSRKFRALDRSLAKNAGIRRDLLIMTPIAKTPQPTLADLTARFLVRPSLSEETGEFEPHEVSGGFLTDPRSAWAEAVAVAKLFGVSDAPSKLPGDWSAYVRTSITERFLPMALGHFPQQVRDTSALVTEKPLPIPAERSEWTPPAAKSEMIHQLLKAAAARSGGRFQQAEQILDAIDTPVEESSKALIANERAALAWQRGDRLTAVAIWKAMPESSVVQFNRGVAALAEGRKTEAAKWLTAATASLPESESWHHLAKLYICLI